MIFQPLSDQELQGLLRQGEADRIECKESWKGDAPERVRQAICAFANDLPNHRLPGVVFVGARDDRTPSGLVITDELLRILADIKTDGKILPQPTLTVQKRSLSGSDMAIVTVFPADAPPVRYEGRTWIRIGSRRGLASKQDERILEEKRRHRDQTFDLQAVPSSTVADLDRTYFEVEYLRAAVAPDVLAANDRSYEQRLAACRMIEAVDVATPTVLGHLAVGARALDFLPGAYVQFLRLDGIALDAPILDESAISGNLGAILRGLDEKFRAHNFVSVDIRGGDLEQRRAPYPLTALQQLVRNAVMHRTYENTNAPVRVSWFSDRIEIWSPGGPYGVVTAENFGRPGYTDYRNPHVAEVMKTLNFVQRFGVGIPLARKELAGHGNPAPEFDVNQAAVNVVVRAAV